MKIYNLIITDLILLLFSSNPYNGKFERINIFLYIYIHFTLYKVVNSRINDSLLTLEKLCCI